MSPSYRCERKRAATSPSLTCHVVARVRESCLPLLFLGTFSWWESWPHPSPVAAYRRKDPARLLGRTLTDPIGGGAQMYYSYGHEREQESYPSSSLICHRVARLREIHPPPLATYNREENWPWGHENGRTGPVLTKFRNWERRPCTSSGKTPELPLVMRV